MASQSQLEFGRFDAEFDLAAGITHHAKRDLFAGITDEAERKATARIMLIVDKLAEREWRGRRLDAIFEKIYGEPLNLGTTPLKV